MNVVYKILIFVAMGICIWYGGYYVGHTRSTLERQERDIAAITERDNQRGKIRAAVLTVSRDGNACWLCEHYAANDDSDELSTNAAVQDIPANE